MPAKKKQVIVGDVVSVEDFRLRPDAKFTHEYKVIREGRKQANWESMEQLLCIDLKYPMAQFCSREHVDKYHKLIMSGTVPSDFVIDKILNERQDPNGTLYFRVRWKSWPPQYDTWQTFASIEDSDALHIYRRAAKHQLGAKGFDCNYWNKNYHNKWLRFMDGMDNASGHALHAYGFLKRFGLVKQITHIADFGFGKGLLLEAFAERFRPKLMYGLEPSKSVFEEFAKSIDATKSPFKTMHLQLECIDILAYCQRELKYTGAYKNWINKPENSHKRDMVLGLKAISLISDAGRQKSKSLSPDSQLSSTLSSSASASSSTLAQSPMSNECKTGDDIDMATHNNGGGDTSPMAVDSAPPVDVPPPSTTTTTTVATVTMAVTSTNHNSQLTNDGCFPPLSDAWLQPKKEYYHCYRKFTDKLYQKKNRSRASSTVRKEAASDRVSSTSSIANHKNGRINIDPIQSSKAITKTCPCIKDRKWDGLFNLGLFVSVGQYLNDDNFEMVMQLLATWCDFLYFDVVTSEDYTLMSEGSTYVDEYAIHRTREWYHRIICKYWRIVGNSILESKYLFDSVRSSNIPNQLFHNY